jgi:hypothetical protein
MTSEGPNVRKFERLAPIIGGIKVRLGQVSFPEKMVGARMWVRGWIPLLGHVKN